ncbi:MAG: NAD-binding protein [Deltaproteobacteria bacterium]|nr:NAD-binding protein [Deltaproteobacteria bacterium]MDQ3296547.1 potassium channel protein [Myxococcota bacterium]
MSLEFGIRRRLLVGLIAVLVVIGAGTIGYWILGGGRWSLFDCLYMTIITITTVGYSETLEGMDQVAYVRVFTIVQLVFGTGVLVFFASTITAFIVEGDLKDALSAGRLKKRIGRMTDHVIVCGVGSTGRYIIEELIAARIPVVAIDRNVGELSSIATRFPRAEYSYLVADATEDLTLASARIGTARGLVAVLPDDKDNVYIVVASRLAGAKGRIIARASELAKVDRFRRVGADGVVTPDYIGSMRLVSEMLRPTVVRFLDDMLRDKRAFRFDEVTIGAGSELDGKTLAEVSIHETFGMSVLALRGEADDGWAANPEGSRRLSPGTILVVLGSVDQVTQLRAAAR